MILDLLLLTNKVQGDLSGQLKPPVNKVLTVLAVDGQLLYLPAVQAIQVGFSLPDGSPCTCISYYSPLL